MLYSLHILDYLDPVNIREISNDVGNIKPGSTLADTYAALRSVMNELINLGKTVIILGGSHDLTLAQYQSYVNRKKLIEVACVDALVDINIESSLKSENFLMEML